MAGKARSRLRGLSDDALLLRLIGMDAAAFEAFYERHVAAAQTLARRIVGSRNSADDVCQDAFFSVWRLAIRFDPRRGNARTWLLTIVRSRALDLLRQRGRVREREFADDAAIEHHPDGEDASTERRALRNVEAEEVRRLLDVLSDDQRRVIELAFFEGYSHYEIAAHLQIPLGTVKARINRGLARMREAAETRSPD